MGTVWKRLDPVTISALRKPGYYADGGGLYLQIAKGGSKSWVLRYGRMGRRREMGLGGYPATTLKQARERASECRAQLWAGKDPIAERRAALTAEKGAIAFRAAAEAYVSAHAPSWRNAKHAQQWQTSLATYAFPVFGDLPVKSIDTQHVLQALEPIWTVKTETASRVRQRIEAVLDWATARRYRTGENPARWRGHLDKLLAQPSRVRTVTHFAALPYADLPKLMADLRQKEGVAARALEFCILTGVRTGEVIGAQWNEIEGEVWTIPAERTKARRPHRVPLSTAVLSLLEATPKASTFVFPGGRTTAPLSNAAMASVLRRMGRSDITVHGFRSAFQDWAREQTNFPREVAEAALAHVLRDKVEAAYARGDLLAKRAELMAAWAVYCLTPSPQTGP